MRKVIIAIVVSVFYTLNVHAQGEAGRERPGGPGSSIEVEQGVNILPPNPTAAELGKYGLIPVGMSTGTANIDIPLHTFSTQNLAVPISLSYNSNGIKVDQIASWVGLGWSLNAGGVVTRIVRDDSDEEGMEVQTIPYPEAFSATDPLSMDYLQLAGQESTFDTERDLYAFNFIGQTGQFVFDKNGHAVTMPFKNILIERMWTPISIYDGQFKITTPDGVKYTFGSIETSRTYNSCGKDYSIPAPTAWYLTEVEHPLGDKITFTYESSGSYFYAASISQTVTENTAGGRPGCEGGCTGSGTKTCVSKILAQGRHLKKIESLNHGSVEFFASKDRLDHEDYKLNRIEIRDAQGELLKEVRLAYTFSNSKLTSQTHSTDDELRHRMFLSSLSELDKSGKAERVHTFGYNDMNGLPPRLSFAQDHWGHFNGAANTHFVPQDLSILDFSGQPLFDYLNCSREPDFHAASKGILTTITYPTGGTSTISYAPNSYYGSVKQNPPKKRRSLTCNGDEIKTDLFVIPFEQTIQVFASCRLKVGFVESDLDAIHDRVRISVKDVSSGEYILSDKIIPVGGNHSQYLKLYSGRQYEFLVRSTSEKLEGAFAFEYYETGPVIVTQNISTGGLRVSKIENYDCLTGNTEVINYHYGKHDDLSKSSGKVGLNQAFFEQGVNPYVNRYTTRVPCSGVACDFFECSFVAIHSSSQNILFATSGNMRYEYVTIIRGSDFSQGAEEHQFYTSFDLPGQQLFGDDVIPNAPLTNTSWDNGLEKYVRIFKYNDGHYTLLKETFNKYIVDDTLYREIPSMVIRKKFEPGCTGDVTIDCNETNSTIANVQYKCRVEHNHLYWIGGFFSPFTPSGIHGTLCAHPEAVNELDTTWYHPCFNKAGESIIVPRALEHLDATQYKNLSYWMYLDQTVEKTFDQNGNNAVTVTKNYDYDNIEHTQLTRLSTTESDGTVSEVLMKYPQDYDESLEMISALTANNIIGIPIKTEALADGNLIGGAVTLYNSKGQPLEKYQYESLAIAPPATHDETVILPEDYKLKVVFRYDLTSANIKEVQAQRSPLKSYLWGYNNTLPVAEIINGTADKAFYSSFEDAGTAATTTSPAFTGTKYWNTGAFNFSVNANFNPTNASSLKMSYWYWQDSKWNFSGIVAFNQNIANGTRLDEVRVFEQNMMMVTYTYNSAKMVLTVTDANNRVTYYNYDDFNRLKSIKDHEGNVVQTMKYHYQK